MLTKQLVNKVAFLQRLHLFSVPVRRSLITNENILRNEGNQRLLTLFNGTSKFDVMHKNLSPIKNLSLELPTSTQITPFTLPTQFKDKTLMYISPLCYEEKIDPLSNKEIEDPNHVVKKEAAKMIRIRRHKMRKHRLKKLRKKMHFAWAKVRFHREKAKEQAFQAELLTQIREVECFDAEKYVHEVLRKIRDRPVPETMEQRRERFLDLRRKHRSHVDVIRPKFD